MFVLKMTDLNLAGKRAFIRADLNVPQDAARATAVDEVKAVMKAAAAGGLKGVLEYNDGPLASVGLNHNPAASIVDATLTRVTGGTLVNALSWYDNEWGFSNRMHDVTVALMSAK